MEKEFLDWLYRRRVDYPPARSSGSSLVVGVGDDGAVAQLSDSASVFVSDSIAEGTHFLLESCELELVGRKAIAVNLSDIAAMGAVPRYALVNLQLPTGFALSQAKQLFLGAEQMAQEYSCQIIGGDTNSWAGPLVLGVVVVGQLLGENPWLNSTATAGQSILVSGELGGSLAGRHLSFDPRLHLVQHVCSQYSGQTVTATDISDSLASDLNLILERSGCGAVLDLDAIPVSKDVTRVNTSRSPLSHALYDGEDFELIMVVDSDFAEALISDPRLPTPLRKIGETTAATGIFDRQGQTIEVKGYEHGK